jgi:flagella basal body P-ring formation protein FlgA
MSPLLPILMLAVAASPCQPVPGSRIMGSDLAAASPVFATLPVDLVAGFAPQPGSQRVFTAPELMRIAQANGIGVNSPESLCFERPTAPLQQPNIEKAMRDSGIDDAQIRIVELSKYPAPVGRLVFPREMLGAQSPQGIAVWNGYVEYDGGRFSVWARVHLTVHQRKVTAVRDLRPGHRIGEGDVHIEETDGNLPRTPSLTSLDAAVGRNPRHLITAGSVLATSDLAESSDVEAGDTVVVEVQSGPTVLSFEAKAESAGRRGDMISLRNSSSGKVFRARVTARNRALVECQSREQSE